MNIILLYVICISLWVDPHIIGNGVAADGAPVDILATADAGDIVATIHVYAVTIPLQAYYAAISATTRTVSRLCFALCQLFVLAHGLYAAIMVVVVAVVVRVVEGTLHHATDVLIECLSLLVNRFGFALRVGFEYGGYVEDVLPGP